MRKQFLILVLLACLSLWTAQVASAANGFVAAQILQVDLMRTEDDILSVRTTGIVTNQTPLTVRGVRIQVSLLDDQHQLMQRFLLPPFPHLLSGQTLSFSELKMIPDHDRLKVSAEAEAMFDSTTYLQIADWIMARNVEQLKLWYVPISEETLIDERQRVESALGQLMHVKSDDPSYDEARRKWNLIQWNYGQRLANAQSLHEAILRLANIESASTFFQPAHQLTQKIRPQAIFKRAMQKAVNGHLISAIRQMSTLPASDPQAPEATKKIKEWKEILTKRHIYIPPVVPPPSHLRGDQRKIWVQMGNGPEGITKTERGDYYRITWWYPDYSHFSFDRKGNLIDSTVYQWH